MVVCVPNAKKERVKTKTTKQKEMSSTTKEENNFCTLEKKMISSCAFPLRYQEEDEEQNGSVGVRSGRNNEKKSSGQKLIRKIGFYIYIV